jgi:hypothetical protein
LEREPTGKHSQAEVPYAKPVLAAIPFNMKNYPN